MTMLRSLTRTRFWEADEEPDEEADPAAEPRPPDVDPAAEEFSPAGD